MATYLNEIKNETLYKRKFFLPINEEDKRHNSLVFLLSNSFLGSYELRHSSFVLNLNRSFISYYMEPNVKYYMNIRENALTSKFDPDITLIDEEADVFSFSDIILESKENDKNYGVSELEKFPMPDVKHVKSAIKFFNYIDSDHEEELANNIKKNIKKFNIDKINVGTKNRFSKYCKGMKQVSIIESSYLKSFKDSDYKEFYIGGSDNTKDISKEIPKKYKDECIFLNDVKKAKAGVILLIDTTPVAFIFLSLDGKEYIKWADSEYSNCKLQKKLDVYLSSNVDEKPEDIIGPYYDDTTVPTMPDVYPFELSESSIITETVNVSRTFAPEYNLSENEFLLNYNEADKIIDEASNYNSKLKLMLYKDRIRSNKEALRIYKSIKESDKNIVKTYTNLERYNGLNLFVDLYYYNNLFLKNVKMRPINGNKMYFKFISNLLLDERYDGEYFVKTVFVPVRKVDYMGLIKDKTLLWDYKYNINIIAALSQAIREGGDIKKLDGYTFVFLGSNGYFKTDKISAFKYPRFITLIRKLYNKELIGDDEENKDSPKAIKTYIVNGIEQSKSLEINNLVGKRAPDKSVEKDDTLELGQVKTSADIEREKEDNNKANVEKKKKELVKAIDDYSKKSTSVNNAIENMNSNYDSDFLRAVIKDIENGSSNKVKISATRAARMNDLNNKFLKTKVNGLSTEELIKNSSKNTPLPKTELKIDTVNEEWKDLEGANFEKAYNVSEDISSILYSLRDKSYPISIADVNVKDTSTSEDHIYTYTVQCEDSFGGRFTLKFDIPKFRNNRFMRLRGNEKTLNGQLLLLPIIKTDTNTVQVVTSYKKIFIRRYGESIGKATPESDKIMKALDKYKGSKIKLVYGDNSRICSKYELPIDYIDLAKVYTKISFNTKDKVHWDVYLNQDELRKNYKVDDTKGVPIGVINNKEVWYVNYGTVAGNILTHLYAVDNDLVDILSNTTRRKKYTYSRASILNTEIPLIVVMAYSEGLTGAMNKAKIRYNILEKRPKLNNNNDIIKFKDGYIEYLLDYDSSLLMNGLKECDTENYSIKDINDKNMWTDFLELFGGRIKADGLDNFYDLTMDPITVDICKIYNLPTDYIEVLAYANSLLADNKYNKHVDISGNRYRTNEQIAALFYEAISEAYEQYRLQIKKGRSKPTMSMKQSVVIDKLMKEPTFSDLSVFSPLLEYEAANAVSFKGKSGMNNDRSYGLDKRVYDKSMVNVLALSTGFAGNVGLTRQTTIDKNIEGKRGLIKQCNPEDMNTTKALCMTEALTPFGTTHDDPFRTAMTFVQTSKHNMRTKKQSPLLITNGADQALPYLCSDMFSYKAKLKGTIDSITKDYMVIKYVDGSKDFIDLREQVKKNSDGGIFEVLKLDTKLKVGDKVKPNQIVAYDKKSFVDNSGGGELTTSMGVLSKVAILETDEGYEDSSIISNRLSENLSSQVVICKPVLLNCKTNIYKMIKKGKEVNVGDTLCIIQNTFDDEDANILMRTITDEEIISEAGRVPIKSKISGVVQDIKIYRTCELEDMSDTLRKTVSSYESEVKKLKRVAKGSLNNPDSEMEPDYKLEPTGKMKNSPDSVLIEFYLRYDDKMSVGDKVVYYSALKGVTKDIFPIGKEPRSDFRPDEPIDTLLSVESINGRMVGSIIISGCINKILIELARKSRDIMGLPQIDEFK